MSYIGLLGDANKNMQRENVQMQYLSALKTLSDQKKDESVKMQLAEQSFYENLNKQAEELLPYDKQKIQEKSKFLQREVRERIKAFGGNRSEFMQGGGISMMSQYMGNLTGSEEFATFKENKKNMTMLLSALSNPKLAAFVTQKDINNLSVYNQNKGGKITYSGLLPELEMPDLKGFDYDKEVADEKIFYTGNNPNAIKYRMVQEGIYKGDPANLTDDIAFSYFKTLNISAMGQNTAKIEAANKFAIEEMQEKYKFSTKQAELNDKKEERDYKYKDENKETGSNGSYNVLTNISNDKKIINERGLKNTDILSAYDDGVDSNKKLIEITSAQLMYDSTSESNISATEQNYDELGWGLTEGSWIANQFTGNGTFKIAGSRMITPKVSQEVLAQMGGGYQLQQDGTILYDPGLSSEAYRGNGVQLTGKRKIEPKNHDGNYRPLGLVTGYVGETTDGNRQTEQDGHKSILTIKLDESGKIDKDYLQRAKEGFKEGSIELNTFVALQGPNGELFYEPIDIDNVAVAEALTDNLKNLNYSKTQAARTEENRITTAANQYIAANNEIIKSQYNLLNETVFNDQVFRTNASQYIPNASASPKSMLLKGLLVAAAHTDENEDKQGVVDIQKVVNTLLNEGGLNVLLTNTSEQLKTWNGSNESFIDFWLETNNKVADSDKDKADNKLLAEVWKTVIKQQ